MTNYEKLMQGMTIEQMAYNNVKLISVNNRELYYVTSSGQLFATGEYNKAVQHEYNWLVYDDSPKTDNKESDTEVSES